MLKYQKALRALELAEDYAGRAYTKLPGDVDDVVERSVKSALRAVRKARDKVAAEHIVEKSLVEEE